MRLEPTTSCMAKGERGFCGVPGWTPKGASEQAFCGLRRASLMRLQTPFCAPPVGWTWDETGCARGVRAEASAPWCICVPLELVLLAGCAVLSVAKLALGQEAYYEQQVAGGLDDYYAGRGESPGMWVGSGAESLGLAGVVGDGDLGVMLSGVNPADGQRLRKPVAERTITVRSLDAASGEWSDEQKRLAPVAGFDLVFSCPKSVSLLHALTDDEQVRRVISDAHERSWQAALPSDLVRMLEALGRPKDDDRLRAMRRLVEVIHEPGSANAGVSASFVTDSPDSRTDLVPATHRSSPRAASRDRRAGV